MTRILRTAAVRLIGGAAVLGAVGAIALAHERSSPPPGDALQLVSTTGGAFHLRAAAVTGLYPGSRRTLAVRASNRYSFPVDVLALTGSVRSKTTKAGCAGGAQNLTVRPYSGKGVVIGPGRTATIKLRLQMPLSVSNGCQGATFTVDLSGRAIRR